MFGKPFWLFSIAIGLCVSNSYAQRVSADSLLYSDAAKYIVDTYISALGEQSEVYNGVQYNLFPQAHRGSPYFQDKAYCTPGLIHYNNTWYKNIPVLYDGYTDVMVGALRDTLYILRAEKVSDVFLSGHHFVYINAENRDKFIPGYYDELYNGKSRVLVKRAKTVSNSVTASAVEVSYQNNDAVYIKNGNSIYQVNSKGAMLDAFKDKKKQLAQYMKDNNIKYQNDKEGAIVKLANYYDQITN